MTYAGLPLLGVIPSHDGLTSNGLAFSLGNLPAKDLNEMATAPLTLPTPKLSFFAQVKLELKKLFKQVPGWEASAAATLTYVAPMVETVVALADPEAAPAVNAIIAKVQSAMAAAAVVVKAAGPTPTLVTYLNAINSDIDQILTAAQVKDPDTSNKLKAITGTITGEINAILAEINAPSAS